jgi:hypothetical protein
MDNVQKHNICTNVPSSQTFRTMDNVQKHFYFLGFFCKDMIDMKAKSKSFHSA